MKNSLLLTFLLLTIQVAAVFAQEVSISGVIKGADDKSPIPGVNVRIKGTTTGTISSAEGVYNIGANQGDVLVFSFVGFVTKEVTVGNQTKLDVELTSDILQLNEVTVTALGIEREKRAIGYALSEVGSEDIAGNGEPNAISSLAGKVAGVNISSTTAGPTGSNRVVIRGISELSGDNQPLYIIDGVPAVNGNVGSANENGGFDLGDGLSDINPNDIETVTVLKGASASVLYGSRALNGVVMITTKKGSSRKGLGIEFNSSLTIDQISTKLDEVQKTYGQGSNGLLPRDETQASNITSNWGPRFSDADEIIQRDGSVRPYAYLENNVQDFFRDGQTWMNSLAISGGDENSNLRLSLSNINNDDIIPNSGMQRNTVGFRGYTKVTPKLSVDVKGNLFTEEVENRPALTDDVNNIGNGLIGIAGNFDQAWLQNYQTEDGEYIDYTGNIFRANPYWTLNKTSNKSDKTRFSGYAQINYEINDKLSFNLQGGTDFFTFRHENFYDKNTPTQEGGALTELNLNVSESNFQGLINYHTEINKDFYISAYLGGNLMQSRRQGKNILASQISVPGKADLSNFTEVSVNPFDIKREVQSVFGSAELSYKEYLFFTLQARNDWASTLPEANRSFLYPSADLSFVATDAFDITSKTLSFAKVRMAYGQVGRDFIPYQTQLYYNLSGKSLGGYPMGDILGSTIPNPNLKPETKTTFEIGTDVKLFNNRIGLDFTYYNERTTDALIQLPVPETTGYRFASLNAATLTNNGVEILLTARVLEMKNGFNWDLTANYARNRNNVEKLHEQVENYVVSNARWAGVSIVATEGQPFGTIIGAGFLKDENGNRIHNGSNGRPMPTEQPIALGTSLPDWTGGLISSMTFKGIELKAALDIRVGGNIFSMTNMTMHQNGAHLNTLDGRDSWNEFQQERRATEDAGGNPDDVPQDGRGYIGEGVKENGETNDIAISPADYWGAIGNNIPEPFIYDASYVKLRDIGLSYQLPASLLKKTPFTGIKIGIIGRNLVTFSKHTPNIDPESNYNNGNGQGLEYGSLPGRKRYGFNLLIKL